MKLHRLELTGFGPFLDTQVVDFDAFDDEGLFLISGRTGTGKSSILDGVSFALYGSVPRYEGGEKRLRSDHAHLTDPTRVRLEFTVGPQRWRVTRAPEYERPARRGGGMTLEPARAELEELVDGEWIGRAAKPRTVAEALADVLGLNAPQFQQVILLAQNKFSRFLLAAGDERQSLLRTLFGTRRFEEYRDELEQRRRDASTALAAVEERARTLLAEGERVAAAHGLDRAADHADAPDADAAHGRAAGGAGAAPAARPPESLTVAARRDALAPSLRRAQYRVEQAELARARADEDSTAAAAAHTAVLAAAERRRERTALRERMVALEARAGAIDADRLRIERARAAATLRIPLETCARADRAAGRAAGEAEDARQHWLDGGADATADVAQVVEALTGDLARWELAAAQESELIARQRDRDEAERTIAELRVARDAVESRRAERPREREAIEAERARFEPVAARLPHLELERQRLEAIAAAARLVDARENESSRAELAYAEAADAAAAATERVGILLRRRLQGAAGELAASLVPGEPCAVCGSTAHPHPATPGDEPITDEMLAAAERQRDAAAAGEVAAREESARTRAALAQARVDATGLDAAVAEQQLADAVAALAEARAATATVEEVRARGERLDADAAADEAERASLSERIAVASERRRAAELDITRLAQVVDDARGSFTSVAARVVAATDERERARAVVVAEAARDERSRAADAARADLAGLLADSPFDGPDDARDALLDDAEVAALEAVVADHAAQLAATRARLLELELDIVGDDGGAEQLAASTARVDEADATRTAAIAAHSTALGVVARLSELLEQVDETLDAVRDTAEEAAAIVRLADTVAGRAPNTMRMDLETFVLAAELEEIVAAANVRLTEMSSGRYTLHHSDARAARGRASGLGIEVLDAHTGRLRPPQSLSGGETFLASLALALGLGEVVTSRAGGIRLDTLFVDEGFGSLDPETLELAMRTLDDLRAGGRTVGVISHVEAMKEQLPAQILVASTPDGPSVIRQDAARAQPASGLD